MSEYKSDREFKRWKIQQYMVIVVLFILLVMLWITEPRYESNQLSDCPCATVEVCEEMESNDE